ncbi:transglutaminase-like domain-containing protein [Nocardia jejuensis]|uniref:transglutaminase-like domain-containing protein n=1 Tax=Nocardia jejuensis TaxID=328049 RepID=UPI0008307550|nr:transglutaminase family protein [Nocardia jejuensis]
MKREVSANLDVRVHATSVLEFQIAVARQDRVELDERIDFQLDGRGIAAREVIGPHGNRIHVLDCPAGYLQVRYSATVLGAARPEPVSDHDRVVYVRPSRYAESDKLFGFAATEFGYKPSDPELPARVSAWVGRRISYLPGSSAPIDGAVETLLSSAGVCRDFSHLMVALLRAVAVPARVVAVYAPGCVPMDFHSVVEACVDSTWQVFDPTRLAPRSSLVRIATGRDASDLAFLVNHGGDITMTGLWVNAFIQGPLPHDDITRPTSIG